jgi:outer membrane receptor protein involved in Fe transport
VVITGTRTPRPLRDVPAAVTVIPRSEIDRSPTLTLDELLRTVPSFATFRRTNSVVSDPTAQGLNLRGVGPSGVSRSLVLVDGVPANDPFGGWFYWRSVPRLGIERIEVSPGGGSALYGNYALGGVVQIVSRPIEATELDAEGALGLPRQAWATARAAGRLGRFGLSLESELFSTAGYPVVVSSQRGSIDRDAPSDHQSINSRFEFRPSPAITLFANGGYFAENQNGGTRFTTSAVRSGRYGLGARLAGGSWGSLSFDFFGHIQTFKQNRARISPDRSSEFLAAAQDVPTDDQGMALIWTSAPLSWAGTHRASAGLELRRIHGVAGEDNFPASMPASTVHRESGGEQRFAGLFVQDSYDPFPALELVGALRLDVWRNLNASQTTTAQGETVTIPFQNRSDRQLSPKLGARVRALDWLTFRGSLYGAFRAPTLNELYRPFQVGTILTAANDGLGPETLRGGEAGLEIASGTGWTVRANGFWNRLENPIANVTLATPLPDGSQRRRQNTGQARIRGIEADAGWHFARAWLASAAYTFVDSALTSSPDNPQLVGKQLAQDPAHRATLSLAFEDPRYVTATLQTRFVGRQFEDDLNQLPMAGFFIVDLYASRRVIGELEIYAAVENLFNREYLVGRAGVDTVGQPFTVRAGLRLHLGR